MTKIIVLLLLLFLAASGFVNGSVKKDPIRIFELKKGDLSVKVTNWGATLVSLVLPDKNGKLGDVVLGYDSLKDYTNDTTYFGATVGRVANRIGGAQFTLNGTHYQLIANQGNNTLHGGPRGFTHVPWKVVRYQSEGYRPRITFRYHSFDGDEAIAVICPLFVGEGEILKDGQNKTVAAIIDVRTSEELGRLRPKDVQAENIIVNLLDWQVIPAENIIAAFQSSQKTLFAISYTASEAETFLEALEHGFDGIVLKVEDVKPVLELKEYFDRRMEESNLLSLTKATVTCVQVAGMGDRVCVDLCSLMRPGEGLLVGSFARGLFLVHSECLESSYIASRPFRVNAGPVHAYVAVPGGRTCYLSELKSGTEVTVVDQLGHQRSAIVGRVKIESRPLILVEAKIPRQLSNWLLTTSDLPGSVISFFLMDSNDQTISILLQNAETVSLVCPPQGNTLLKTAVPVTSLKVGDEVLLRVQGGARHTGIEIQEFIAEN